MRIYYASQSFYPHVGGVSTYLLNLASSMIRNGHEVVEVHLRTPGDRSEEEIKGVEVKRVPREPIDKSVLDGYYQFKDAIYSECHYGSGKFPLPASQVPGFDEYSKVNHYFGEQLKELLEDKAADIVHIHDFQLLFAYKYVPRGTPLVFTWHIPFPPKMSQNLSQFLIRNLQQYDKVIFSSAEYIEAAVGLGLERSRAELIYPITDTALFRVTDTNRAAVREKYGMPQRGKIILSVQRVDQKSGHEQLIRAMPKVLEQAPDSTLVFVGGESMSTKISDARKKMREEMDALVKSLKLRSRVLFIGNVDYNSMPEVYNASDAFALCSKNEGFGLAITEAMYCGKAVVGTKVGGIPLQVRDKMNGFLVDVGDHEATAKKLIMLLKNEKLARRMGQNAVHSSQKFSRELGLERHMSLYNALMREKNEMYRVERFDARAIRAVITDFDRTVTERAAKHHFDKQDIDFTLLKEMKSLGIDLFLATGRPFKYVEKLCNHFKGYTCVVAENGAVVYFPKTKRTFTIDTKHMQRARSRISRLGLAGTIVGEVIASVPIEHEDAVRQSLGNLIQKVMLVKNVDKLMIVPHNVDKGYGLRLALQYLNIDMERTVVVGDGENDVGMFLNPGYKIALANAHPRLKRLAHEVTKSRGLKGMREIIAKIRHSEAGSSTGKGKKEEQKRA